MKLFGRELFSFKREPVPMYDFAQHGLLNRMGSGPIYFEMTTATQAPEKEKKEPKKIFITPKGIYEMKSLNAHDFVIRTDAEYLKEQIECIQDKLDFLGKEKKPKKSRWDEPMAEYGGVKYGRKELESIKERLENRMRIGEFKTIIDKYPHTTSELMNEVVNKDSNLRCERADTFIPDFPKDAINAMKEYNCICKELCNKTAIFYVIAQSKDFQQVSNRRDPILLAQSPFGFFWQILGAWDAQDMKYLGDL